MERQYRNEVLEQTSIAIFHLCPKRLLGSRDRVDAPSDVIQYACITYNLLSSETPLQKLIVMLGVQINIRQKVVLSILLGASLVVCAASAVRMSTLSRLSWSSDV